MYGRAVEELQTVDACVEEIIASYAEAVAVAGFGDRPRIYERLTEIVLRAQEIPRPGDDLDSQLRDLLDGPQPPPA